MIGLLVTISIVGSTWLAIINIKAHHKKVSVLKSKEVALQRKAEEARELQTKVEARQKIDETVHAQTIDLTSHTNASLSSSFVPKNAKDNNLSELPEGTQTYAGVPFKISGSVQLSGGDLTTYSNARFPNEVTGIEIGASCEKLHILHGSYFIKELGTEIAKLVVHYTNGSTKEISIIAGKHVLDWWAPDNETGVRKKWRAVEAPGSELAWVGTNPYIRRRQPHLSLHLFKSTFENPLPSVSIATIDYVSTQTAAAPFLLGLTLE